MFDLASAVAGQVWEWWGSLAPLERQAAQGLGVLGGAMSAAFGAWNWLTLAKQREAHRAAQAEVAALKPELARAQQALAAAEQALAHQRAASLPGLCQAAAAGDPEALAGLEAWLAAAAPVLGRYAYALAEQTLAGEGARHVPLLQHAARLGLFAAACHEPRAPELMAEINATHAELARSLGNLHAAECAWDQAFASLAAARARPQEFAVLLDLAQRLLAEGQYFLAGQCARRASWVAPTAPGLRHAMSCEVASLMHQGRLSAGVELAQEHLRLAKAAANGERGEEVALSLNNLAVLHQAMGAYEVALPLAERALAIFEKVLGAEHPDVAQSLNTLAGLLQDMGAYEVALPLAERALAVGEKALGAEHPHVALSLNNLAELHRAMGAYEVALPLAEQALAIGEKVLGAEHPHVAASLNNLALLHQAMGADEVALPLAERALAIWEKALGAEHPHTRTCRDNLARLRKRLGSAGP